MDIPPNLDRLLEAKRAPNKPVDHGALTRLLVFAVACLALMAAAMLLPPLPMDLGTLPVGP